MRVKQKKSKISLKNRSKYFLKDKRCMVISDTLLIVLALTFFSVIAFKVLTFEVKSNKEFVGESAFKLNEEYYDYIKKNIDEKIYINRLINKGFVELNNKSGFNDFKKKWVNEKILLPNIKNNLEQLLNTKQEDYNFNIIKEDSDNFIYLVMYKERIFNLNGYNKPIFSLKSGIRKLVAKKEFFNIKCSNDELEAFIDYDTRFRVNIEDFEYNIYEDRINKINYDIYEINLFLIHHIIDGEDYFEVVVGCS